MAAALLDRLTAPHTAGTSLSATNCATPPDCHTSANGRSRLRHHRGAFTVHGNGPSATSRPPAAPPHGSADVLLPSARTPHGYLRSRPIAASPTLKVVVDQHRESCYMTDHVCDFASAGPAQPGRARRAGASGGRDRCPKTGMDAGWLPAAGKRATRAPAGSAGEMAAARVEEGDGRNTGRPCRWRGTRQAPREGQIGPVRVAARPVGYRGSRAVPLEGETSGGNAGERELEWPMARWLDSRVGPSAWLFQITRKEQQR